MVFVQKDNVANQREHLILLLANAHIRKSSKSDSNKKGSPHVCSFSTFELPLKNILIGEKLVIWILEQLSLWLFWQLDDKALDDVMGRLFENYKSWCSYLGRERSLWYVSFCIVSLISLPWSTFRTFSEAIGLMLFSLYVVENTWKLIFLCVDTGYPLMTMTSRSGKFFTWGCIFLSGERLQISGLCQNAFVISTIMYSKLLCPFSF